MGETAWLVCYSASILLVSVLGGLLPLVGQVSHGRLQFYLSASAGVMLGASFFHVMPEAIQMSGEYFGWWMSLGVVGLFCVERFIAPHSHESNGHRPKETGHSSLEIHFPHEHHHDQAPGGEHRPAAPAMAGWMAVLGLTIHTFMNGVGLAGAVQLDADRHGLAGVLPATAAGLFFPGWALFLAIVAHKPADALAVSTVLCRKGTDRRAVTLVQIGFALMVPVGVAAFYLTRGAIAGDLRNQLTGAALAFSAGTFLFISLSDLLPEVQFHRHDRVPLFMALVLGVVLMGGIAYLEDAGRGAHSHGSPGEHQAHDPDGEHPEPGAGPGQGPP